MNPDARFDYSVLTTAGIGRRLEEDRILESYLSYASLNGVRHSYTYQGNEYNKDTRETRQHLLRIVDEDLTQERIGETDE
jgi:hypothetical protein